MKIKIKNISKNEIPSYETLLSAGMDLRAHIEDGKTELLPPGGSKLIKTGISIALPEGYEAQIRHRSGLAYKNGITLLNAPGTIDADYRGDVGVILVNHSNADFPIVNGDRIAQMVIAKYERVYFDLVDELDETERGKGGFGSTGKN